MLVTMMSLLDTISHINSFVYTLYTKHVKPLTQFLAQIKCSVNERYSHNIIVFIIILAKSLLFHQSFLQETSTVHACTMYQARC